MEQFNPIKSWLDNVAYSHSKSENTANAYQYHLNQFLEFINKSAEEIVEEYEQSKDDKVFRRRYAQYVKAMISQLANQNYATGSINTQVATVKSFFKYSDLPLGFIPTPRNKIKFHNRDITKEEITQVLTLSKIRDKCFFVMMTQSGLRPSVLCQLRIKHLQFKKDEPCAIIVPEEISKGKFGGHFTFVGQEAEKYLKKYLSTRTKTTNEDLVFTSYKEQKGLSSKSISEIFMKALEKLRAKGILKFQRQPGKPAELRLYCLRKFFRKHGGQAGVDYVNFWMGHKTNYKAPHIPSSDEHYFNREDIEFQRKLYKEKALPHLRLEAPTASETDIAISVVASEVEDLKRKVEKRDKTIEALTRVLKAKPLTNEEIEKYRGSYYFDQVQTLTESYDKLLDMIQKQQEEIKRLKQKKST